MHTENLLKLADFLEQLPPEKFDISWFARDEHGDQLDLQQNECSTVACAIGWGPAAGFPVEPQDEDWISYGKRVFGLQAGLKYVDPAWKWCFSEDWMFVDPSPLGAAKRIRHLVEHGLPEAADRQRLGKSPYMFADAAASTHVNAN